MSPCRLKCKVCTTSSEQMFRLSLVPRGFWSRDAGDIPLKLCFIVNSQCKSRFFMRTRFYCPEIKVLKTKSLHVTSNCINLWWRNISCRMMWYERTMHAYVMRALSLVNRGYMGSLCKCYLSPLRGRRAKKWPIAKISGASTLFLIFTRIWNRWVVWLLLCQVDE